MFSRQPRPGYQRDNGHGNAHARCGRYRVSNTVSGRDGGWDGISYAIEADYVTVGDDLVPTSREVGTGTYTVSGTTLTRTVINSTNSNALLNLAGDEQVIVLPNAADFFIAATQADQETGSINTEFVTPGIQQFHPSAAKCWGFTIGGGTPVLTAPSYNMTSITDTGVGILTVTIATDFSSANYVAVAPIGIPVQHFVSYWEREARPQDRL